MMQDVLAKLKEIQENYDNEDIQRAINAAEKTAVAEEDSVEEVDEEVVEESTNNDDLERMIKLAGRSGVMGMNTNVIIAESESVKKVNEYKITTRDGMEFDQEEFNLAHAVDTLTDKLVDQFNLTNDSYDTVGYTASDYYGYPDLEEVGMPMYYDLEDAEKEEFLKGYKEPPVVNPDAIKDAEAIMGENRQRDKVESVEEETIEDTDEAYSPGDENAEGMVSNCCSAPVQDEREGTGRCSACGEGCEAVAEESVEEATVEVPVQELADLMQLAGYANYADKIEEYANEPEEEYSSAEDQMDLGGGLNGPKKAYAAAAGGDNPMDQEPTEIEEDNKLTFEGMYKRYMTQVVEETLADKE